MDSRKWQLVTDQQEEDPEKYRKQQGIARSVTNSRRRREGGEARLREFFRGCFLLLLRIFVRVILPAPVVLPPQPGCSPPGSPAFRGNASAAQQWCPISAAAGGKLGHSQRQLAVRPLDGRLIRPAGDAQASIKITSCIHEAQQQREGCQQQANPHRVVYYILYRPSRLAVGGGGHPSPKNTQQAAPKQKVP